jgi:hypothetical protein
MDGTVFNFQHNTARDLSRQAPFGALGRQDMQVPMAPTDTELVCEERLQKLFSTRMNPTPVTVPAPATISDSSTTNSTPMSSIAAPRCPFVENEGVLTRVPMRLIPMTRKDFTDRHLRETYRYYKLFVSNERKVEISEWPEGITEKTHWRQRMVEVGREVRFLGRRLYQKAVQDAITERSLTMSCGQSPRSWTDHLGALFNPSEYSDERRDFVYWIQFGMLKDANNAWIHKHETRWCSEKYGIQIVYDKDWEGNNGIRNIDVSEHGTSFLPFERARGSWFKWHFLKGANEIRENLQLYSLRAHGIYERICISKRSAGEARMSYTKRKFTHGGGYIAEPLDKKKRQEITAPASTVYTMEGVTAWLRSQGKAVTIMPESVYMTTAQSSGISSVTRSEHDPHGGVLADTDEVIVVQQSIGQTRGAWDDPFLTEKERPLVTNKIPVS